MNILQSRVMGMVDKIDHIATRYMVDFILTLIMLFLDL